MLPLEATSAEPLSLRQHRGELAFRLLLLSLQLWLWSRIYSKGKWHELATCGTFSSAILMESYNRACLLP